MLRFTRDSRTAPSRRHRRSACRPQPEALEGRRLLSAGDLDPTFGTGGYTLTSGSSDPTEGVWDYGHAVTVLGDGSILVAGMSNLMISAWRLTPDGELDPSFGVGGRGSTSVSATQNLVEEMVVLPDGRFLIAGYSNMSTTSKGKTVSNFDFSLVRFLPDGSLDTSFGPGGDGKVNTNISTTTTTDGHNKSDQAFGLTVQADGRIVMAGRSYSGQGTGYDSTLVRYDANGVLDPNFGVGGKVVLALSTLDDGVSNVTALPDGKILAMGRLGSTSYLACFDSAGNLDPSFGIGGITEVGFAIAPEDHTNLAVQADGRIVIAGIIGSGMERDLALARFNSSGTLDSTFGNSGLATADSGLVEWAAGIRIQGDGAIVVAGYIYPGPGTGVGANSFLARFRSDGTLDADFGNTGFAIHSFGTPDKVDSLYDLAIQPDGKIVAVGIAWTTTQKRKNTYIDDLDALIARFEGDAAPLLATVASPTPFQQTLTEVQARLALTQALAYRRPQGENTSRLGHIDLAIAELGGNWLGEASGTTITFDDNAGGWGTNLGRGRKMTGRWIPSTLR